MKLEMIIGDYAMELSLDEAEVAAARDSLERLDRGMDRGIRLGSQFLKHPDSTERCQYAANKLLSAIESHNEGLAKLAAGYILTHLPGVTGVHIDTNGEPQETKFRWG